MKITISKEFKSKPILLATFLLQTVQFLLHSTTNGHVHCEKLDNDITKTNLTVKSHEQIQMKLNEIEISSKGTCDKAMEKLDKCSSNLIGFGPTEFKMPENTQELDSNFCPKFLETVKCIKETNECFKPFERQIVNWILSSTRKMNYKRCKNPNEKQRFLRLSNSCLLQIKNPMDDCMEGYVANLEAIADLDDRVERLSEDDIQIQLSCCANRRFKQCVSDNAKKVCSPIESVKRLRRINSFSSQRSAHKHIQKLRMDTMEDLKSTLDGMALTGPEFICGGVDEKFCRSKFDHLSSESRRPRHKSIVPAMIKIYANK